MAIAKGKNHWVLPEIYPEPLRNLAWLMLSLDPHERPTAEEACIEIENFMSESNLTFEDFLMSNLGIWYVKEELEE